MSDTDTVADSFIFKIKELLFKKLIPKFGWVGIFLGFAWALFTVVEIYNGKAILNTIVYNTVGYAITYIASALLVAKKMVDQAEKILHENKELKHVQIEIVAAANTLSTHVAELIHIPKESTDSAIEDQQHSLGRLRLLAAYNIFCDTWSGACVKQKAHCEALQFYIWSQFAHASLKELSQNAKSNSLRLSSRAYTEAVLQCCKVLADPKVSSSSQKVVLHLFTSMLPDEFFNWPQSAFDTTEGRPHPVPIGRAWDGADDYIKKIEEIRETIEVSRCIFVKQDHHSSDERLACFRTSKQLSEVLSLVMRYRDFTYSELASLDMGHLIGASNIKHPDKLAGYRNFRFFPIGRETDFDKAALKPTERLLEIFIEKLHSSRHHAFYYPLNSSSGEPVLKILSKEMGTFPEIALFGLKDGPDSQIEWKGGIHGSLLPFTDTMHVSYIAGDELNEYINMYKLVSKNWSKLGELSSKSRK